MPPNQTTPPKRVNPIPARARAWAVICWQVRMRWWRSSGLLSMLSEGYAERLAWPLPFGPVLVLDSWRLSDLMEDRDGTEAVYA